MRNIALLEWGPASLFYQKPRELIKVRTEWFETGPTLPHFSEPDSSGVVKSGELDVRYALSAFEDLNGAIKNLRLCFGFPYSEYIGYLNTLTKAHRARREHQVFIDRLRRWATFNNIDAVVWIDYAKSNQPPGSFKMGPIGSRPFSKAHIQVCVDPLDLKRRPHDDEESELPWSDADEDVHHGEHAHTAPAIGSSDSHGHHGVSTMHAVEHGHTASIAEEIRRVRREQQQPKAPPPRKVGQPPARQQATPRKQHNPDGEGEGADSEALEGLSIDKSAGASGDGSKDGQIQRTAHSILNEKTMLKKMIQEEVVPVFGSIYTRSLTPGPGYYGVPDVVKNDAASFGIRRKGCIDTAVDLHRKVPAPGVYEPAPSMVDSHTHYGTFHKVLPSALMLPPDKARKLPFISTHASLKEAPCVHSPSKFYDIVPEKGSQSARTRTTGASYTFCKVRRPF
jgi:hypothetical protein